MAVPCSKEKVIQLIHDSILNLCRFSMPLQGPVEVDAIVCITQNNGEDIVVKVHKKLDDPNITGHPMNPLVYVDDTERQNDLNISDKGGAILKRPPRKRLRPTKIPAATLAAVNDDGNSLSSPPLEESLSEDSVGLTMQQDMSSLQSEDNFTVTDQGLNQEDAHDCETVYDLSKVKPETENGNHIPQVTTSSPIMIAPLAGPSMAQLMEPRLMMHPQLMREHMLANPFNFIGNQSVPLSLTSRKKNMSGLPMAPSSMSIATADMAMHLQEQSQAAAMDQMTMAKEAARPKPRQTRTDGEKKDGSAQWKQTPHNLECPVCGKRYGWLHHLRRHILSHQEQGKKNRIFLCGFSSCDFTASTKQHLTDHVLKHFDQKPYKCGETGCKSAYKNKAQAYAHFKTYHGSCTLHICPNCVTCFSNEELLIRHQNDCANQGQMCPQCGCFCVNKILLAKHLADHFANAEAPCAEDQMVQQESSVTSPKEPGEVDRTETSYDPDDPSSSTI